MWNTRRLRVLLALGSVVALAACGDSEAAPDAQTARDSAADVQPPEDTPAAQDTPGADGSTTDVPVSDDVPAVSDTPASDDAPGADVPDPTDVPVGTDVPPGDDVPAATDVPTGIDTPTSTDVPVSMDVSTGTDVPVATDGGCPAGFADCDRNRANGCEADLSTTAHCGACGTACLPRPGSTAACTAGRCAYACVPGRADCNGSPADGCETDLSDPASCGRCGNVCGRMSPFCNATAGTCVSACPAGTTDCNRTCVDLQNDLRNCGACGRGCGGGNATITCSMGACRLDRCDPGFANCDGVLTNGCEVNTNTSEQHCGRCMNRCAAGPSQNATCTMGSCVRTCSAGFADCDMAAINGCEVATSVDVNNCGACGRRCALPNATNTCRDGACGILACGRNYSDCDRMAANGCETPLDTVSNCGMCGRACTLANATAACTAGLCAVASCSAGYGNCDGLASNGCETNTNSSELHCGRCGNFCLPRLNATTACTMGACAYTCRAGFGDCDGMATNGCETALITRTHCGACGRTCAMGQTCVMGACR